MSQFYKNSKMSASPLAGWNAARGNFYVGTSFPANLIFSNSLQRVFSVAGRLLTTATCCNVSNLSCLLFYL